MSDGGPTGAALQPYGRPSEDGLPSERTTSLAPWAGRALCARPMLVFGIAGTHRARSGLSARTAWFGRSKRPNGP